MGRRSSSRRRVGVLVPGAYAVLLANARKMAGFCVCDLPPLDPDAEKRSCLPHERLAALEAGEPVITSPRAFSWALAVSRTLDDLGAVVSVHPDDLVTVPDDDD